jgi:hypothetical protein
MYELIAKNYLDTFVDRSLHLTSRHPRWSNGERACHWAQGSRVQTRQRTMYFKGDKTRSTPSFGAPVGPTSRFTKCKRILRAWKDARRQNSVPMFLTRVLPASLLDGGYGGYGGYGGFTTRCLWWLNQDDNPHRIIPNCHETRKGGQGPTLGCSAIDDDDDVTSQWYFVIKHHILATWKHEIHYVANILSPTHRLTITTVIIPTPCRGVPVQKLTVAQLLKKFFTSYGTWSFITVFATVGHWTLS